MIKVFRSPRDHFLYFEEADLCVCVVSSSDANSVFEVRPRQACGACVCTGLGSPRACRCCGTGERSIGILHSENPSCVEGGDVEQVCSNLETNPLCLRLPFLSLSPILISCIQL